MALVLLLCAALPAACASFSAPQSEAAPASSSGEAASSPAERTGGDYKVAYCTKRWSGSEHWITVREGVDAMIRPEDEYIFLDANGDLDAQVKAIEDLIAQQVDAIICSPRGPDGLVAVYERAREAGVRMISLDCSISQPQFEDAVVKMDYV